MEQNFFSGYSPLVLTYTGVGSPVPDGVDDDGVMMMMFMIMRMMMMTKTMTLFPNRDHPGVG